MGLGFEVNSLDCVSVVFILLCWLFGKKKGKKKKRKKMKKKKKGSFAHSIFTSLVFGISMVCRRYHGLIIISHFGLRDLFFF